MKAIIYAGIGLFSIASVYGVTDFYQTQKKGTLKNLYKEDEEELPIVKTIEPEIKNNVPPEKNEIATTKIVSTKKINKIKYRRVPERTIRLEQFSRGRISERRMPIEEPVPEVVEMPAELKPTAIIEPSE